MPELYRARVANVKYNSGLNLYDDYILDLGGTNTLIDLENGQGKTLFLQCIAQTIVPGAKFSKNWPVSKLFDESNDNRFIHCMTEWKLDEGSEYNYALVGFCGFKVDASNLTGQLEKQEDRATTPKHDHIKYICYYNEPNQNDISHFPLYKRLDNGQKKAMSQKELVNYLNQLKEGNNENFAVVISGNKSAHYTALSLININAFEWKFMLDLNKDEASTYDYYAQFNSPISFIKDCLIKLVESSNQLKIGSDFQNEGNRAKLLMALQETLQTLKHKQELIKEYYLIEDFCNDVSIVILQLKEEYINEENLLIKLSALKKKVATMLKINETEVEENKLLMDSIMKEEKKLENDRLEIKRKRLLVDILALEEKMKESRERYLKAAEQTLNKETQLDEKEDKLNKYESEYLYTELLALEKQLHAKEVEFNAATKDNSQLFEDYKESGNRAGNVLLAILRRLETEIEETEQAIKDCRDKNDQRKRLKYQKENLLETKQLEVKKIKENLLRINDNINQIAKEKTFFIIDTAKKEYNEVTQNIIAIDSHLEVLKEDFQAKTIQLTETNANIQGAKEHLKQTEKSIKSLIEELLVYEKKKEIVTTLQSRYQQEHIETFLQHSIMEYDSLVRNLSIKKEELDTLIANLSENSGLNVSLTARHQFKVISNAYPNAIWGSELLKEMDLKEKEAFLTRIPLLMYAIVLEDSDFVHLCENKRIAEAYKDELVPIINSKALRSTVTSGENLTFTSKPIEHFIDAEKKKRQIAKHQREMILIENDLREKENYLNQLKKDQKDLSSFMLRYPDEIIEKQQQQLKVFQQEKNNKAKALTELESLVLNLENNIKTNIQKQEEARREKQSLLDKKEHIEHQLVYFKKENELLAEKQEMLLELKYCEKVILETKDSLYEENQAIETTSNTIESLVEKSKGLNTQLFQKKAQQDTFPLKAFNIVEDKELQTEENFDKLLETFTVYARELLSQSKEIASTEKDIKQLKTNIENKIKALNTKSGKEGKYTLNYFRQHYFNTGIDHHEIITQIEKSKLKIKKELKDLRDEERVHNEIYSGNKKLLESNIAKFDGNFEIEKKEAAYWTKEDLKQEADKNKEESSKLKACFQDVLEKEKKLKEITTELTFKQSKIKEHELRNNYEQRLPLVSDEIVQKINIEDLSTMEENIRLVKEKTKNKIKNYKLTMEKMEDLLSKPNLVLFKEELSSLKTAMPTTDFECNELHKLLNQENGYLAMVKNEIYHAETAIEGLKRAEDHFIGQCIQMCKHLYNDIMAVEKLSRITINDRKQQMVQVQMKPTEENYLKGKMQSYIRHILEEMNTINDEASKFKTLSSRLALKELFVQYIEDVNRCDVKIYKAESKAENSRMLSWRKAMGSKGQSNGMYLNLSICLLAYIRQLHNPQRATGRKFLLLDAPWSGTQAAYIWQPIIKLLEQNNTQLLCVGYEPPSQLLSLFDTIVGLTSKDNTDKKSVVVETQFSARSYKRDELYFQSFIGKDICEQLKL